MGQVKNPRWPPLLKIANNKYTSSPEPLGIIGYEFAWNIIGTLVFKIVKIKKSITELDHSDLLSVYKSNFAQMPISQENMNVFWSDLITMVSDWNYIKIMQTDLPRWSPGSVTKNNTKMTISQEPLVEISPNLCLNVSCGKPL